MDGHRVVPAVYQPTGIELDDEALPGSVLGARVTVSCYHHQAIDRLGELLTVTGRAPDGTIEAVVARDRQWAVGVQWHPEEDRELRLFAALVEAAGKRIKVAV
jgi:gamma-glutamyl-gamma-aminobutyrate hydrolase PuuD